MHVGKSYSLPRFLYWTRRTIFILLIISAVPTVLYYFLDLTWLGMPWVPIALIGTAAAFIIGFRNTQTYNRLWEARQIYGGIVNGSRSWGILVRDTIDADESVIQELFYRHFAWLTALRFQLRKSQSWENFDKPYFKEYRLNYSVPEWEGSLEDEMSRLLSADELKVVLSKKNRAAQLLAIQSKRLAELRKEGRISELNMIELEKRVIDFYDQQGKCERIKNFPYPRQFSSLTGFFIWMFVFLAPFGMLNEFAKLGSNFVWLTIPFTMTVSWVFVAMDKVAEATENPFEGGANDIPMAALSRNIEIDLREMLNEEFIPDAIQPVNNILM